MRIYPQKWIGGSRFINYLSRSANPALFDWEVGELKILALFGYNYLLCDNHTIDSPTVSHLFRDRSFRQHFLASHPHFFRLIARPEEGVQGDQRRFSVVTSGLRGSAAAGNVSSAVLTRGAPTLDPRPYKDLAEAVITRDATIDVDFFEGTIYGHAREVLGTAGRDWKEHLTGVMYALAWFMNEQPSSVHPTDPRRSATNLLDHLKSRRESPSALSEKEILTLDLTLKTINDYLAGKDRTRQAVIWRKIDDLVEAGRLPRESALPLKRTVNNAWNVAVETSIQADKSSWLSLGNAAPIGLGSAAPSDLLTPASGLETWLTDIGSQILRVPRLSWDPRNLSWSEVAEFGQLPTATAFQYALSDSNENILEAFQEHVNECAKRLKERDDDPILGKPIVWLLGPALIVIGNLAGWPSGAPLHMLGTSGFSIASFLSLRRVANHRLIYQKLRDTSQGVLNKVV